MENSQFLKMGSLKVLLFVSVLLLVSGCSYYGGIKGTVVDNTTGKPIEGAVVVAQWTKPRGLPGMQYHNLHKITETLTDKEGKFSLSGTIGILIDPPEMIIYKNGYIPWRNDSVFPSMNKVKNNEWNDCQTYKLDKNAITEKEVTVLSMFVSHAFMTEGLDSVPKFNTITRNLDNNSYEAIQKAKQK